MVIQRIIDDDRLTDAAWNSEMRDVELWENERLGGGEAHGSNDALLPATSNSHSSAGAYGPPTVGWSKANLRGGGRERGGWTRGRDGWNGVGGGGSGGGLLDGQGEVRCVLERLVFYPL